MAVTPECHFDLKTAAFFLAEILSMDALSENRFRDEAATSLPKFHGAAAWINTLLYIILKVETSNGTALWGLKPSSTLRELFKNARSSMKMSTTCGHTKLLVNHFLKNSILRIRAVSLG